LVPKSSISKELRFNKIIAELLNVRRISLDLSTLKDDFTIGDIKKANHDYRLLGARRVSKLNFRELKNEADKENKSETIVVIHPNPDIIEIDDSPKGTLAVTEADKAVTDSITLGTDSAMVTKNPAEKDSNLTTKGIVKKDVSVAEKDVPGHLISIIDLEETKKEVIELDNDMSQQPNFAQMVKKVRYGKKQDNGKLILVSN
jgi:hypothetical protein